MIAHNSESLLLCECPSDINWHEPLTAQPPSIEPWGLAALAERLLERAVRDASAEVDELEEDECGEREREEEDWEEDEAGPGGLSPRGRDGWVPDYGFPSRGDLAQYELGMAALDEILGRFGKCQFPGCPALLAEAILRRAVMVRRLVGNEFYKDPQCELPAMLNPILA